jgi:hypothetical protein
MDGHVFVFWGTASYIQPCPVLELRGEVLTTQEIGRHWELNADCLMVTRVFNGNLNVNLDTGITFSTSYELLLVFNGAKLLASV